VSRYEVYATGWDDPTIREELIPARDLEFSLPLNDHGECSFSATVEPGRSFWRPSIAPVMSGVLIARDGVPVWSGMVWSESQTGPRTFSFRCAEWGSFFERVPAVAYTYTDWNDHALFRDLISRAAAISGQDPGIIMGSTLGGTVSDKTINAWDDLTVERAFRDVGDAAGGPDWYFGAAGTLAAPERHLVLGDNLGAGGVAAVLEYVEAADGSWSSGGNVIGHPSRVRDGSQSATATVAIGSGEEKAQLRRTATSGLLSAGYPRLTHTASYTDVKVAATLQRHATVDLSARAGLFTSYTLATWDGDPDWTQVPRGSTVRVSLDTDVYQGQREVIEFDARVMDINPVVSDVGTQVNWTVSTVLGV
jgi:hypothetical protein